MSIKVPGWDCADGTPEEDHDWELKSDFDGDPEVINGTQTYYWLECAQCGKEKSCENPQDYIDDSDLEDWHR